MTALLEATALSTGYAKRVITDHVTLRLHAGELVCLIGPNGVGKSTLLRTLAGMQPALSGTIAINGQSLHTMDARNRARHLSIVLTDRPDVSYMTGYALVALGRHPYTDWSGALSKEDEEVIQWAVTAVGAQELAERRVNQLSDGERQKLMIARALAQEPSVMILDEPTAFLDLPRRVEMMGLLQNIVHQTKRVALLSTHDLDLALRYADRIWLMGRDGQVLSDLPENLVLNGAFERIFASEGVLFDPLTGSFKARLNANKPITVLGDGLRAIWTKRALERAGYALVENAPIIITVREQDWCIGQHTIPSLENLLQILAEMPDHL